MSHGVIVVKAVHDPEANVWLVVSSSLPGLNVEADTVEELAKKLPAAIEDLLSANEGEDGDGDYDVPVELIANLSTLVKVRAEA